MEQLPYMYVKFVSCILVPFYIFLVQNNIYNRLIYGVMISKECLLTVSLFWVLEIINEHDMLLHQETLPSAVLQARQLFC